MKKLSPQEVYKRLKFKESIQKKIKKAKSDIDKSYKKLSALQKSCPHYDSIYVNKGDSGSWDRDDYYWREYECFDCGLRWQTEQSIEMEKKYPYAVNKTYK